jgi:hypothetical protein
MEIFDLLKIGAYIDFIVIVLVIAGGYAVKRYWSTPSKMFSTAWKTLIVSTTLVFIYTIIALLTGKADSDFPMRAFISYTVATSLYDLLLKNFTKKLKVKS